MLGLLDEQLNAGGMEMKSTFHYRRFRLCGAFVLGCGAFLSAQNSAEQNQEPSRQSQDAAGQNAPASDNTKMNQRDRSANEPTADQQQNGRSDRDLTQQVRKAITAEKSFSTYAHNVKVVAQNGHVTLKGPVRSDEEKQAVEAKAAAVAGASNVTSELTVKPKS